MPKKRKIIVTPDNREEVLQEYWLCGECDSPEYHGESTLPFGPDVLFLCACKKLHMHPHCLPKEVMLKNGKLKSTKDIMFYCLRNQILLFL